MRARRNRGGLGLLKVCIRISATAVTSSDCYLRGLRLSLAYRIMARLMIGWNAPRQPVLGLVLSGEVDSVGPDAKSFAVGDRVFGFNRRLFGTYAQYVCWPEDGLLAPRPANLTDEESAAIPYGASSLFTSCARPMFERGRVSSCSAHPGQWARRRYSSPGISARR